MPQPAVTKLGQPIPDQINLNQGTQVGAEVLDKSLEEVGYARSPVMSANGVVLCGKQTQKAGTLLELIMPCDCTSYV